MSTRELGADVVARLTGRREAMIARIVELARIETPSADVDAHGPALALTTAWLRDVGMAVEHRAGTTSAGILVARPAGVDRQAPRQLLIGHIDTVWPVGTTAERPVRRDGELLWGPGVLDMKAGIVHLVAALEALRALGVTPTVGPEVLLTTDEEAGSVDSAGLVDERARGADRALVLEPAVGMQGRVKTRRKGTGRFTLVVEGRAAHAGLDPEKGISAVVELAHQILAVAGLHAPDRGVTVNVGLVRGGVGVNTIAPLAEADLDVRAWDVASADRLTAALRSLSPKLEGAKVRVDGAFHRPPMVPTPPSLWRLAVDVAAGLGLALQGAEVGGASDGNTASQHTPTLDGLGAVGDGAHAVSEHVRLDRMIERTAMLALLIAAPPLGTAATR